MPALREALGLGRAGRDRGASSGTVPPTKVGRRRRCSAGTPSTRQTLRGMDNCGWATLVETGVGERAPAGGVQPDGTRFHICRRRWLRFRELFDAGLVGRPDGGVAQLVAHLHGMQRVRGSSPLTSTITAGQATFWLLAEEKERGLIACRRLRGTSAAPVTGRPSARQRRHGVGQVAHCPPAGGGPDQRGVELEAEEGRVDDRRGASRQRSGDAGPHQVVHQRPGPAVVRPRGRRWRRARCRAVRAPPLRRTPGCRARAPATAGPPQVVHRGAEVGRRLHRHDPRRPRGRWPPAGSLPPGRPWCRSGRAASGRWSRAMRPADAG